MKVALITGVSGQDGSYMAELLVEHAYRVVGTVRSVEAASKKMTAGFLKKIELVELDMSSQADLMKVIEGVGPSEIYNFAACSSGSGMYDDPVEISEINGVAVLRMLEAIRLVDKTIRFCQASSREVFGEALESPQTEGTWRRPRSPYGAAKLFADSVIDIYRKRYGMFAASAILFNHESPRRDLSFVTRKVTREAVRIKLGLETRLPLGNLDARRDWGFAGDYVKAMWLMLQQPTPDDYIVSTGTIHSVRDLCETAFAHLGLDYRDYVEDDETTYRPNEPYLLVGSPEKARRELGWIPEVGFAALVSMMVDADMQSLTQEIEDEGDIRNV